jgi:hypothetical protein
MDIKTFIAEKVLYEAYNEAAEKMNGGMINTFNEKWEGSGKEFGTDEYNESYFELFRRVMQPIVERMTKYLPFVITVKDEVCTIKPIGKEKYEVQWMYDLKKK